MKHVLAFYFVLQTLMACSQDLKPSEYKSDAGSITQLIATRNVAHPRLLLLKGEEKNLLAAIEKEAQLRKTHAAILNASNRLLSSPPVERIQIGRRLLDKSREALRRIFLLSYAYRTTGQEKYLRRAEKEMLAVSAFSDWNPTHFLDVAEMTMAVAIGYDWLYDALPESTRKAVREAIMKKGIEPSYNDKYNWFLNAEHNWNQVCNAGMTFGALAIAEHEPDLAGRVISRAIQTIPKSMEPYGPDGGYPEGYGYWGYGTSFNVMFLSALEKALGTDYNLSATDGFMKTAGFYQHIVGPTGMVHNWGDSGLEEGLSPALFWFASKEKAPSLLWRQKMMLEKLSVDNFENDRLLPAMLIWGADPMSKPITPPKEKIWVGQGPSPVGMMRTSWQDPNAIFVGFKAGSASVNHAHMDVGSFVMDAQGERWAMDFGPQNYNSLEERGIKLFGREQDAERWDIFRYNNLVHNTLTIDGEYQRVKGYAKIDAWSDDPQNLSVISDLSEVYEGQATSVKRGVALVDQHHVVVRDEVEAPVKDITLRWTLLTPAKVKIVDERTVELTQNGKTMYLMVESETPIELKTWSTVPTHDYDAPNPGTQLVGFESRLPARTSRAFNVYLSPDKKTKTVAPLNQWKGKTSR
jgi:hypothetical protein